MRERIKFALVATMLMTLTGLSWLLPMRLIIDEASAAGIALSLLLSTVITGFSAAYIRYEYRNAAEGLPLTDERSTVVRAQAGNYAFFMCAAIALMLYALSLPGLNVVDFSEIGANETIFALMVIMVSTYLGTWIIMTSKWRIG